MSLTLWRKTVYVYFCPLLLVWSKKVVYTNPNISKDLPISNMIRKINFPIISVLVTEIVTFMSKKKSFLWISQKSFKTSERHRLAVCGSLCGEKQFLLIFVPFYWFVPKKLFKQIQIFVRIFPFSHMVRKTNFLNISVLISDIVIFMSKKKFSQWISPKMLQNNRKA